MSKTVLCVLLKVLMSARADISPKDLNSNVTQDIPLSENNDYHILQNLKSDRSQPDSVNVGNKIDEIPFTNMSVIPESTDSTLRKPTSLKAFVEFYNGFPNKEDDIYVTFRWNQPNITDKLIQGYTVQCWFIENQKEIQICNNESISAAILERTVHNLKPNTTYYFQVQAHTKVGAGPYTNLINVSTTHENPIPRLLTISNNGIDIWDLDSKINVNLVVDNDIQSVAYWIVEHKIFWSNQKREIMMLKMNENNYTMKNITKITELQYVARDLCIDWIARNLYWMESDYISGFCDIVKLDLTMWENGIIKYDKISKIKTYLDIDRLTILPSIGTLYWTNYSTDNNCQIIQSDLDGKNARTFQNNSFIMSLLRFPLYTSNYLVDMKIDDMNTKEPLVYWLWHDFLFVTDINVFIYNLILHVDNFTKNDYQIRFQSLTIDKTNIYISIVSNKNIYVLKKEYALLTSIDAIKYIQKITASSWINNLYAFGKSLQPPRRNLTSDKIVDNVKILKQILVKEYYLSFHLSSVAIVTIIWIYYFYYLYQRKKSNEQVLPPIMTDIELAILREFPINNIQCNMLYKPMLQYNSDVLIKIKREQITLEKCLGSGAFGRVFQGKVKNLEGPDIEIPAAIKMLRKNASSQDKEKFLEEARLMNYFRHKHVLRLLAVCLDEDSPLIVLELIEIGDLLQYLRDSRKLQPSDLHVLRLQDLFAMCEDVARGCCYLENLHFVHRDLAARNCLVSARDRENRVIKIGDFGLTRDISKNKYHRSEGQYELPICWMAPESLLVDGIFTSQSDVWSFGILMCEITSLGEHPYPGMTFVEVIDYVHAGGRLSMPLNCPPTLYELMSRCWNPADDRPNFELCLENIIALRNNIEDTFLNPVDI
ncbi:proto-oncogene tyrosine-protein kinase ROS-like isoform X2 [Formica exsecta]|uniref:proto-oncogene tyrosine-protein kinase ROS-like isoform X2 n=1 Tax=Formica exsecta TaxID=72781 RepID=UPI0011421ED2|nr:proto-oncogene tyrosine-protein kinase ROS-like isoform X2 [Formica exsecta]XP_029680808.1 proto-oncogene tyrosine-protein kinase ROS-like isoform X2 [Formica exsecta]XP_029680809.1 proto-oncogene tyrosine-protein kinase ROS-like isoform X2 [Formica exsecta]